MNEPTEVGFASQVTGSGSERSVELHQPEPRLVHVTAVGPHVDEIIHARTSHADDEMTFDRWRDVTRWLAAFARSPCRLMAPDCSMLNDTLLVLAATTGGSGQDNIKIYQNKIGIMTSGNPGFALDVGGTTWLQGNIGFYNSTPIAR